MTLASFCVNFESIALLSIEKYLEAANVVNLFSIYPAEMKLY